MQFSTLAIALFVALGAAEHHHGHQHFNHRRQMNATSSAASTTLTVFHTVVHTITSCAPTITNCPARSSAGGGVITETITLATTVCPVAAAESISSSIVAAHVATSGGVAPAPPISVIVPMSTGVSSPVGGGSGGSPGNGASGVTDTILTYTLGTGSSTTVVTTTIKHTTTTTAYVTEFRTKTPTGPSMAPFIGGGGQPNEASQSGPTTTITRSSTQTKYVTVMPVQVASSGVVSPANAPANGGSGNCAPVTVTMPAVTVTMPASTVTVTYSPMGAPPTAALATPVTSGDAIKDAIPISTSGATMPSSIAGPYGNGTASTNKPQHGHAHGSTGFLTMSKAAATMSAYY